MSENNIISVENFAKEFKLGRKIVKATRNISFSIPRGQTVGFVGPNGAGKSTTIKTLLGFIKPTSGTLLIGGFPAGSDDARRLVGFMPEHPSFPDTLTGAEWIRYAHRLHKGAKVQRSVVLERLEEVGIAHAADRLIRGYSKGMLQRLGLAQALVADPQILILDEPLSGLDPMGRGAFKDLLQRHADAGKTLFFTSHILDDVENLCERIILIDQGKVAIDAPTFDLLHKATSRVEIVAGASGGLEDRFRVTAVGDRVLIEVDVVDQEGVMRHLMSTSVPIFTVQPLRHSLEQLFLDVVKGEREV